MDPRDALHRARRAVDAQCDELAVNRRKYCQLSWT